MNLPNIILILADDMGYGDPGCYGGARIPTPNMDALAREGMRFTDAHSSSAVCTPSRYSVITGRYCWRTRLTASVLGGFGAPLIDPDRMTMASLLKTTGYSTAAIGKWHLGLNWQTKDGQDLAEAAQNPGGWNLDGFNVDYTRILDGPTELGFDSFFGIAGSLDMPPYCFIEDDHAVGVPDREKEHYYHQQRKGLQTPDWRDEEVDVTFARKAVEFLEKQASSELDSPFFLYLAPASPHRPCDIRPDFVKGRSEAGDRGDMVVLFDWVVGQVMDALERLGLAEDTLLIVTSDNGGRLTCADNSAHGHKTNGDWRGQKGDIWDGGHREPLIVRWPGTVQPGTTCNRLICLGDFMATCAELLDVPLPQNAAEDSFSFLPALTGQPPSRPVRDAVVHHSGKGMFSIRKGKWKLVQGVGSGGYIDLKPEPPADDRPPGQLYDLDHDPAESTNLWFEQPSAVRELEGILEQVQSGLDSGCINAMAILST